MKKNPSGVALTPQLHWYAARTKRNQEQIIKSKLEKLNIVNFAPFHTVLRQWSDRRKKVNVPVIPNIVFIRTDYKTSINIPNIYGVEISYLRRLGTTQHLVVPDKQMDDFILLCNSNHQITMLSNGLLRKHDKVRIIKGSLFGVEGELISDCDRKQLIVRLDGIAHFTVNVSEEYLEKL